MFESIVDEFLDDAVKMDAVACGESGFGAGLRIVDGTGAGPFHVLAERPEPVFK